MHIYKYLNKIINDKGAAYLMLLDPDKAGGSRFRQFVMSCVESGVDGFLIGGSLMMNGDIGPFIKNLKNLTDLPAIIFPGSLTQITPEADALLFLSVISGRNPEHLIGKHVLAAPLIKKAQVEVLSTGYIIVESGSTTTAQYMSGSLPVPRNKPEIAAATALAGEYLGMKLIYLEAGSGADLPVPDDMIKAVSKYCSVPVIAGGGIKTPADARSKVESGASIIVTGNFFENENNWKLIKDFARAVHKKEPVEV